MIKIIRKTFSKKFKCGICFSSKTASKLISIGNCRSHVFCSDCIAQYVKQKVESKKLDINCPMYQCPVIMSHSEVLVLIDKIFRQDNELTKKKYKRFFEMKTDPNFRECSICRSHLRFNLERSSEIKCKCGKVSCFTHGIGHPNQTCAQYEKSLVTQRDYQLSINTISKISKKCPHCKVSTERNGGCDHMTCSQCGQHWYWNSDYGFSGPQFRSPAATHCANECESFLIVFVITFVICMAVAIVVWLCTRK